MNSEAQFIQQTQEAFSRLSLKTPDLKRLVQYYTFPDRHYHNLEHILECHALLHSTNVASPRLLIAFSYHDAIYDTKGSNNERLSAELLRDDLQDVSGHAGLIEDLMALIIATDHKTEPVTDEQKLIADIDLSILGSTRERYHRYAQQIRQEYSWVPEADYKIGRSRVLEAFLKRQCIYRTQDFHSQFEVAARENLEEELMFLNQK
jgi:predicted metal-dependent HD superfamily phosphohydrolase